VPSLVVAEILAILMQVSLVVVDVPLVLVAVHAVLTQVLAIVIDVLLILTPVDAIRVEILAIGLRLRAVDAVLLSSCASWALS